MSQSITPELILEKLRWRYAVKKFDSTKRIPDQTWDALEQALVLTPSSFGLQPWKFIVITEQSLKEKLRPLCWNQSQVADCSHLLVCTIRKNIGAKEVDKFIESFSSARSVELNSLEPYKQIINNYLSKESDAETINHWASRQVYIALGNFMTSAALLGIDTCPMEGFEPKEVDEILGLEKQNLHSIVLCPAGYRSPDDSFQHQKKVRFDRSLIIEHR